jgi:hypothetical protein
MSSQSYVDDAEDDETVTSPLLVSSVKLARTDELPMCLGETPKSWLVTADDGNDAEVIITADSEQPGDSGYENEGYERLDSEATGNGVVDDRIHEQTAVKEVDGEADIERSEFPRERFRDRGQLRRPRRYDL